MQCTKFALHVPLRPQTPYTDEQQYANQHDTDLRGSLWAAVCPPHFKIVSIGQISSFSIGNLMNLTFHLKMGRLVTVFELSATFHLCAANAHETDCNA